MNEPSSSRVSPAPVLQAEGLGKRFVEGPLDVQVLQGVDLVVGRGETLASVFARHGIL